jgi:integrase/recombinase XerD
MWDYWITLFTGTHCVARGLRPKTIAAYGDTLQAFRAYAKFRLKDPSPDQISPCNALAYVQYLRDERKNGASAVNRQVTILKSFYRAIVAMGHLEFRANPMANFPKIKAAPRKVAETLSEEEVQRLMASPDTSTILGLRDRAMLVLLYGTGMRASECSGLDDEDFDFEAREVRVVGKGGHERTLPLHAEVVQALLQYRQVRGKVAARKGFFEAGTESA